MAQSDADPHFQGAVGRIQTLLENGVVELSSGVQLDPAKAEVFLCGNPDMIEASKKKLLTERGLAAAQAKEPGTIHIEEYPMVSGRWLRALLPGRGPKPQGPKADSPSSSSIIVLVPRSRPPRPRPRAPLCLLLSIHHLLLRPAGYGGQVTLVDSCSVPS